MFYNINNEKKIVVVNKKVIVLVISKLLGFKTRK